MRRACTRRSSSTCFDRGTRSERYGKSEISLTGHYKGVFMSISCTVRPIPGISRSKKGSTGYNGYKRVKENKLSALVYWNGLPLACTVAPANAHDSQFYPLIIERFEILETTERPVIILADIVYNAWMFRQYRRNRGIQNHLKIGKYILFEPRYTSASRWNSSSTELRCS
jgi:hypothetical protein